MSFLFHIVLLFAFRLAPAQVERTSEGAISFNEKTLAFFIELCYGNS